MVKRWQFEAISVHADNEIDTILNIKNIAKSGNFRFYMILNGNTPEIHKSDDFESADTIVRSGDALVGAYSNKVVRKFGVNMYGFIIKDQPPNIRYYKFESNDSGDNWVNRGASSPDSSGEDGRVLDITDIGGEYGYDIYRFNKTERFN